MNSERYKKAFSEILPFIYQNNLSHHLFIKLINKVDKDVFIKQALTISNHSASKIKLQGMHTKEKRIAFFRSNKKEITEWLYQWLNSHDSKNKGYELLSKWGYVNLIQDLKPIDIEHFLALDEFVFDIERKKRYYEFADAIVLVIIQLSTNAFRSSFESSLNEI